MTNRSRHLDTVGRDTRSIRAVAELPSPPAIASMILARSRCPAETVEERQRAPARWGALYPAIGERRSRGGCLEQAAGRFDAVVQRVAVAAGLVAEHGV